MEIRDGWKISDGVSGLEIEAIEGEGLNRLHIKNLHASGVVDNRDFFFTEDGGFDGTGSSVSE